MGNFQDLTGMRYGKLLLLSYAGKNRQGQSLWLCQCDCGKTKIIVAHRLKVGATKSCGCLIGKPNIRHGMSHTVEHNAYVSAKKRCTCPTDPHYVWYGARGIEFRFSSFEEFLGDVGYKPKSDVRLSLDRIDNNGHYEKGNVRWATDQQQNNNRRNRYRNKEKREYEK